MRVISALVFATLLAPAAVGQQGQLGPRSFFPANYTGEIYANMKALMDTDVWDEVERSLFARAFFSRFRDEFGFRLDSLDEFRSAMLVRKTDGAESWNRYRIHQVMVFRGRKPMKLPGNKKQEYDWNRRTEEEMGTYRVVKEGDGQMFPSTMYVVPRPKCLIYGSVDLIAPVLRGERVGGVPHPDLLAFTAQKRPMFYFATKVEEFDEDYMRQLAPFPMAWYTEKDKPTFLMFRVNIDEETQEVGVSLRLRFTNGSAGPASFEGGMKESFKQLDTDEILSRIIFLKEVVKRLKFRTDATDLVISCDLGEGAEAIEFASFSQVLPYFFIASANAAAPPAVVAPAPVPVVEEVRPVKAKPATKPKPAKKTGGVKKAGQKKR